MLPELWHVIFEFSHNKELNILNQCCRYFYKDTCHLLKSRRLNYPRNGKHVRHEVQFSLKTNLDLTLKYLYFKGIDLVKGDIIYTKNCSYEAIYTGDQLVKYYNQWFEPIELDVSFDIIKDKVPFDYWDQFEIYHIDLTPYTFDIKYDLLSNIVDDYHPDYKNHYVLYTKFIYSKNYIIILNSDECHRNDLDNGKIKDSIMPIYINLFKYELEDFYCMINSDYGSDTLIMIL